MQRLRALLADGTLWRFLLVGAANTLVGSGVMLLLYNLAQCSYWLATAANYVVGGVLSYFLNKYFTFRSRKRSWREVGRFVLTVAACWLIAYGLAKPLMLRLLAGRSLQLQENAAMLVGMALYTALNYFGQKLFAFRA